MKSKNNKVVVRIAPSPTGNLHMGTARTALFNFLFARHNGGKFLIRIEDTDTERSDKKYERDIFEGLEWLGITSDEIPLRQSERNEVYKKYAQKLVDAGVAQESDGAVVLKNQKKEILFEDAIRGEIKFEDVAEEIVIMKSDGTPTYNFAVVVDDYESGITHIIRGEDHISNTPRQVVIMETLGFPRPVYVHLPMILGPDRSKLSKRHGAVSLLEYRDKGYLPQAMVNYLALLGWNPGTDQEIFIMEELIKEFSLEKIQKSGAIFDEKKLEWVNREHLKRLPPEEQKALLLEKIKDEDYIKSALTLDISKICWKDTGIEDTKKHLERVRELVGDDDAIMKYAEKAGRGSVLWPLRYALSGLEVSPDPFTLLEILGRDESLKRIEKAIKLLE